MSPVVYGFLGWLFVLGLLGWLEGRRRRRNRPR